MDPATFRNEHRALLSTLPSECQPPDMPHGFHSYTVQYTRKMKTIKIEVRISKKGFRVNRPKMPLGTAWFHWSAFENPGEAWNACIKAGLDELAKQQG